MGQPGPLWRTDDAPPPAKQRRRSGVFSGDVRSNQMLVRWENVKNWIDKERFEALTPGQVELLHSLVAMHPDADPHYLIDQILAVSTKMQALQRGPISEEARRNFVATAIFERLEARNYPRLSTRQREVKLAAYRDSITKRELFSVNRFLERVPDPFTHYSDTTKNVSDLYKEHVRVYLKRIFPEYYMYFLNAFIIYYNGHLYPIIKWLETETGRRIESDGETFGSRENDYQQPHRRIKVPWSEDEACEMGLKGKPQYMSRTTYYERQQYEQEANVHRRRWPQKFDEDFFLELQFVEMKEQIMVELKRRDEARDADVHVYRNVNLLMTCSMCYMNDCLPEEMTACCLLATGLSDAQKTARAIVNGQSPNESAPTLLREPNDHIICGSCMRAHTLAQLEQGFDLVACTAAGCDQEFSLESVKRCVTKRTFDMFERRREQKNLRDAGIELTYCPRCDFAVSIEDESTKELVCLNEECLETSCIACKRSSHLPLSCEEAKRNAFEDERTRMRVFIENKIAEALIRYCPRCNTPIVKTDGCDRITCSKCRVHFCYRCRFSTMNAQEVYNHLAVNCTAGLGVMGIEVSQLRQQALVEAGMQAREEYLKEHPELAQSAPGTLMTDDLIQQLTETNTFGQLTY